jgi:hypothetical protein
MPEADPVAIAENWAEVALTPRAVVYAVAVTDIEFGQSAKTPNRILNPPAKNLRVLWMVLAGIDPLSQTFNQAGAPTQREARRSNLMLGIETSQHASSM